MKLVLRNLLRRPRRTGLTLAGVAIGAATYMLVVGAAEVFVAQFSALASALGGEIIAYQRDATSPWSTVLKPTQIATVRDLVGAHAVSRLALGKTQVAGGAYFLVFGLDPSEPLFVRLTVTRGRPLAARAGEVMLGHRACSQLGIEPAQFLVVRGERLKVVGVYRTGHPVVDGAAIMELTVMQRLFNLGDGVNLALIDAPDRAARSELIGMITSGPGRIDATTGEGWVRSFGQVALVEEFARYLALLGALVAFLGVANILSTNLNERTAEIAILRTLGWGRSRIALMVACELLVLALLGTALAAPLAHLVVLAASTSRSFGRQTAGFLVGPLPIRVALEALVVSTVSMLVAGAFALARVLRTKPAAALRAL